MITEDYVSFETAKLLKEKGFDVYVRSFYDADDMPPQHNEALWDWNLNKENYRFSAPTLSMAMKWLREEKKVFITIGFCDYPALHKSEWVPEVCTHNSIFDKPSIAYSTYEEACEAAIRYCLENLI